MSEIKLHKRVKYAGDVHTALMKLGWDAKTAAAFLDSIPDADAVEVVRCKDCVFWKYYCRVVDGVESDHVCSIKRELDGLMHRTKADDFCSWAKRKEE